jgi:hypothetical protein
MGKDIHIVIVGTDRFVFQSFDELVQEYSEYRTGRWSHPIDPVV